MAKTLMYAAGSPTSVKIGDTDTNLYLQVAKDNVAVDLTSVKSINIKIADSSHNFLKTISVDKTILNNADEGIIDFPLTADNLSGLPAATYYFEVWIVTADSDSEIYPDTGFESFTLKNNIEQGSSSYTTITLKDIDAKLADAIQNINDEISKKYSGIQVLSQEPVSPQIGEMWIIN